MPGNRTIRFFKPYGVLSQFTDQPGRPTLKDYISIPGIYAAGRLDYSSEGLLILSSSGPLIHRISDPDQNHSKTYLVQLEGLITSEAVVKLNHEIVLPGIQTRLPNAREIPEPDLPPRPVPVRNYHPTSWIEIRLNEGKKHQVRRMTAAVGFPTLRLVRFSIVGITIEGLQPGEWRDLTKAEMRKVQSS